jgi:hypothetical protein
LAQDVSLRGLGGRQFSRHAVAPERDYISKGCTYLGGIAFSPGTPGNLHVT